MTRHDVCWEDRPYEGVINTNSYLEIALWYLPNKDFHIQCDLWCTFTGQIPQKPVVGPPGLFQQLESGVVKSAFYFLGLNVLNVLKPFSLFSLEAI